MEDAGYFPHLQAPQTLLRLARGFSGSAPPRRLRHLEAGVALDVFDDGGQILRCRALMHRVLEHEPRRLTHPHRHAELLALRDRQIDVLHQDVHLGAVIEAAGQHGAREFVPGGAVATAAGVDRGQHHLGVQSAFGAHDECLGRRRQRHRG